MIARPVADGMGSIGKARVLPSFYSIGRMRDGMPRNQGGAVAFADPPNLGSLLAFAFCCLPFITQTPSRLSGRAEGGA